MEIEDLHKIISKPDSECDGFELHLKSKWKHNNAKAIFQITGLYVSHLLSESTSHDGIIVKNPTEKGPVYYV